MGMFTGVEMPLNQQLAAGALTVMCGLSLLRHHDGSVDLRSENAVSIANGLLVVMSFSVPCSPH